MLKVSDVSRQLAGNSGGDMCRQREWLNYYSKRYPGAWKVAEDIRTTSHDDWPDWCHLPSIFWADILGVETANPDPSIWTDMIVMPTLGAWRLTQGIYRFDQVLYRAIIDTPVIGELPVDIFHRLPEWCVYVESPGLNYHGKELLGFFAHLDRNLIDPNTYLRLVFDYGQEFSFCSLRLNSSSLEDSIRLMLNATAKLFKDQIDSTVAFQNMQKSIQRTLADLEPILSLLIFMCSQNGEIGDDSRRPSFPKAKKTKKGLKVFPPDRPTTWDVGVRLGSALKQAYEYSAKSGDDHCGCPQSTKRPHIRRAHWHRFRLGPRKDMTGVAIPLQKQKLDVKWLPPIAVKLDDPEQLPATIRPIQTVPMNTQSRR